MSSDPGSWGEIITHAYVSPLHSTCVTDSARSQMIRTGVAIAGTRNCNGETKLHYKLLDFSVPLLYTPACRRVHSFLTCGGLVQTFQRRIKSMKGYILCRSQARIHVCPSDRAFVTLRRLRRAHKPTPAHALISNPLLNDAVTTGGILLTATSMVYVLHFLTLKSFIDRVRHGFVHL